MADLRKLGIYIITGLMLVSLISTTYAGSYVNAENIHVREAIVQKAGTGNIIVGLEGLEVTSAQEKLIKRINEVRYEACTDGKTPDPRNKTRMLTPEDYVPMKLGVNCTKTAVMRAAEASVCLGHIRPTQDDWSIVASYYNSTAHKWAENLAWNANMSSDIEGWIDERDAYLGLDTGQTGHYETLINPNYVYTGMATFNPVNDSIVYKTFKQDWSCTAGSYSDTDQEISEYEAALNQRVIQKIEIPVDNVTSMDISGESILNMGDNVNVELLVGATFEKNDDIVADCTVTDCQVYDGVAWSSSDTDVLEIDSTGALTAKNEGTAVVTAVIGSGTSAKSVARQFVIIPEEVTVVEAENPDMITVETKTKPVLPKTVKVILSNDVKVDEDVVWEDYDSKELNTLLKSNEFEINGTAGGRKVVQKIHVNAATVTAIYTDPKTVTTDSGKEPDYPKALLFMSNGIYYHDLNVDWDSKSLEYYKSREGGTFTLHGVTQYSFDTDEGKKQYPVTMTLVVNPAVDTTVSFDETAITTVSGIEPVYPKAKVTWSNGDVTNEDIIWNETEDFKNAYKKRTGGTYIISGSYDGKVTSVKVNVTPAIVTDVTFDNLLISVDNGTAPKLPEKADVRWSNGDVEETDIVWETVFESQYRNRTGGEFTVNGTVAGEKVSVKCKVAAPVIKEQLILSDMETIEGCAPSLPKQVNVNWNNGMTTNEDITWEDIDEDKYSEPDTVFEVSGMIDIAGDDDPNKAVTVKVNVRAKSLTGLAWKEADNDSGESENNKEVASDKSSNPSGIIFYGEYDWSKISGTLIAKYDNGTSEEIDINDERLNIYGFAESETAKEQKVEISYTYGTGEREVTKTVSFTATLHLPESLIVNKPTKLVYVEGQSFDDTGLIVVTVYDDGEEIDPSLDEGVPVYKLSGYDSSLIGVQKITVAQDGLSESFDIRVIQRTAAAITVSSIYPQKQGKKLNVDRVTATITFNDGDVETFNLADLVEEAKVEITGYDRTVLGMQTIKIKYDKVSCEAEVEVKDKVVTEIEIVELPKKYNYVEGTELDLAGGVVTIYYDNDTSENADITKEMILSYDKDQIGLQVITVSVEGKSDTFSINVKAKQIVSKYSVAPYKVSYIEGASFELDGGSVIISYDNGTESKIALTNKDVSYALILTKDDTVLSDLAKLKAGDYRLEISYKGEELKTEYGEDIGIIVKSPVTNAAATVKEGDSVEFLSTADDSVITRSIIGMTLYIPCADGSTEPVTVTKEMIKDIVEETTSTDEYIIKNVKLRVGYRSDLKEGSTEDDGIYAYLSVKIITDNNTDNSNSDGDEADDNVGGANGEVGSQNGAGGIVENGGTTGNGSSGSGSQDDSGREAGNGGNDNGEVDNYKVTTRKSDIKIKLAKTSISKLVSKKKAITVKWKKASAYYNVTGYQVQLSLNKNFKKNTKTVTISKRKTASKTIKKLKSKKKYYVRIRTYFKSGSHGWYSAWSKVKTVKTK